MFELSTSKLSNSTFQLLRLRRGRVRSSLLAIILVSMAVFASAASAGYFGTAYVSRRINLTKSPGSSPIKSEPVETLTIIAAQDPVPPVTTDKMGYLVGETVNISGTGFAAGENVTVQVRHADNSAESGGGHDPFVVTALADGTFSATWNLTRNDSNGNAFVVSAVGSSSGHGGTANFKRIATVRTDKFDYKQGETVAIQGNGFAANETVTIHVVLLNGRPDGNGYSPFTTTSDENGQINASWPVDPTALDSILLLTARGHSSNLKAQTIFTDVVVTTLDDAGPDDQPGQKDLNQVSTDNGNLPTSLGVTWNWDDTAWSGNNTGDACSLFDTDADGFANFALCVTVAEDPAAFQETRLYSCSDTRADRCSGATQDLSFTSSCTATIVTNSDPFRTNPAHTSGNTCDKKNGCYTDDMVAACTVQLADVGAANARLLNVCSYPSQEPGSDPSDCVVTPNNGFLTIKKTTQTSANTSTNFVFNTNPASQGSGSQFSQSISGQQSNVVIANMVSFAPTNSLSITEVVPSGWDLTGATCQVQTNVPQNTGTFNGTTAITGVSIQTGLETICTFTDAQQPKLTVTKTLVPSNDTGKFNLQIDGVDKATDVGDGGTTGAQSVTVGSHTVGETAGTGTSLTDYTTVIGGDCDAAGNVSLAAGDNKTCTITNTRRPKLTVTKLLVPTTDSGLFNLKIDGATIVSDVGHNGTTGAQYVSIGAHTVAEAAGTGTNLNDYTTVIGGDCDAAGNVSLAAGDNKTCTITNTRRPKLTVTKLLVPTTDSGLFNLKIDGATIVSDVGHNGTTGAQFVSIGAHTVAEAAGTGTNLNDYTTVIGGDCDAAGNVSLAAGDNKTCTITNTRRPKLTVTKLLVPTTDSGLFNLKIDGATIVSDVGHNGTTGAQFVSIGAHTVAEAAGTGTNLNDYTTVIGGDCDAAGNVSLAAGDNKTCTITNTRRPKLTVTKLLVPTTDSGLFNLKIDGATIVSDVGHNGTTGAQYVTIGAHTVAEAAGTGTSLSDYVTVIGGHCAANGSVTLAAGESKTCTITNTKKGMVTVTKYTNGQLNQTMAWNFSLVGPSVNTTDSTPPTLVDFGGTKLIPGEVYKVCETGIPAGWTLEWKGDSPVRDGTPDMIIPFVPAVNTDSVDATLGWSRVFDPNYVDPPAIYTNDTRCVNFKVAPGETLAFSINNSFPGGEPRTIGYWKNWSSCTGGNQMVTAAKNGGPAAGWYTLDDLLNNPGYTIGILHLGASDCLKAVRILDKSEITTGKKLASDGAYNLAAQLLAAELNLSAGAETCPAVTNAVTAAQNLLASINFDGTGSYLKKGAVYNQANSLAATLDKYNNGLLCP